MRTYYGILKHTLTPFVLDAAGDAVYSKKGMKKAFTEKIADYVSGFTALRVPGSPPVGAVIFEEKDRATVRKELAGHGVQALPLQDTHPGEILRGVLRAFQSGAMATLEVDTSMPPEVLAQLSNLTRNVFDAALPGEKERAVLNPIPQGARVLLLMSRDSYENTIFQDIISSACRIQ